MLHQQLAPEKFKYLEQKEYNFIKKINDKFLK